MDISGYAVPHEIKNNETKLIKYKKQLLLNESLDSSYVLK